MGCHQYSGQLSFCHFLVIAGTLGRTIARRWTAGPEVTPGSAPRTYWNPLFPVNYVDRLLRHRVKEHTEEIMVPESIRRVWMLETPTPAVRWQVGQKGTTLRLPAFARRDLLAAFRQGC